MKFSQTNPADFIAGTIVGGILGGIAGLLLAPKSGCELRKDIEDAYHQASEKLEDLVDGMKSGVDEITDIDKLKKKAKKKLLDFEEEISGEGSKKTLILGAIAGGVLGATAMLLMGSRVSIGGGEYRNTAERWKTVARQLANRLADNLEEPKNGTQAPPLVDEIVDWASLGIRTIQKLRGQRR